MELNQIGNTRARLAIISNSTNGEPSSANESMNTTFVTPTSDQVDSQMWPNSSVQSANLCESELIDVPPYLALNSTELSTMTMINNLAIDLRHPELVQSEYAPQRLEYSF